MYTIYTFLLLWRPLHRGWRRFLVDGRVSYSFSAGLGGRLVFPSKHLSTKGSEAAGGSLASTGTSGRTPLHFAARERDPDTARFMLQRPPAGAGTADVNAVDGEGLTPLLLALTKAKGWTHMTLTCLPAKYHLYPDKITQAVRDAVARMRADPGPFLIEAKTYRFYNHHGVQNLGLKYRTDDEVAVWKERDPIFTFEDRLIEAGTATRADIDAIWEELRADIETAIQFAEDSPLPDPEAVLDDVYSPREEVPA